MEIKTFESKSINLHVIISVCQKSSDRDEIQDNYYETVINIQ